MASDLKYLNSGINFGFVVHEHNTGMLTQLFHLQLTMEDVSTHIFFFFYRVPGTGTEQGKYIAGERAIEFHKLSLIHTGTGIS